MSALVAYDSSSDEEEVASAAIPQAGAAFTTDNTTSKANGTRLEQESLASASESKHVSQIDNSDAPMIGPTIPETTTSPLPDHGSASTAMMSERELIRYLTQASHPMTSLPPSPPSSPDPNTNLKFKRFLDLKEREIHFNEDLARKTTFRNPSLLGTLMARAGVEGDEQYRTTLRPSVWDMDMLPPFAYKEELLKSQQNIRDKDAANKKVLSASGKRTIEFTSGTVSGSSSRTSTPGQNSKRRRP